MWIISKIRNDNSSKMLLANFTYLSIIEIIGLLLPLITFPYLIRTIGAQKYGIIVFAQTIVAYLVMIVNFGFNVSATRRISENRHNINKINEIYSSVIFQKLLIFIIALVVTIIILYLFDYKYSFIIIGLIGLCIQEVLFPIWLYQGMEKMRFITIITSISKCSFLVLIFVFIRCEDDYVYIPLLYSFGGILTSLISYILLYRKLKVKFIKVTSKRIIADFKESLPFFASRLASVVMERTNVIAIGTFFSYEMVAIYDLCAKVVSVLKTPYSLIAQVIYPNVSKSKDLGVVRRTIKPMIFSAIVISVIICLVAHPIVLLLGGRNLNQAAAILQLMVWYVPIVGVSFLFGAYVLVVKGHSKEYNLSVIYSVILYLLLMAILVLLSKVNLYTMVLTFVVPELFLAIYRIIITKKYNLLKTD